MGSKPKQTNAQITKKHFMKWDKEWTVHKFIVLIIDVNPNTSTSSGGFTHFFC